MARSAAACPPAGTGRGVSAGRLRTRRGEALATPRTARSITVVASVALLAALGFLVWVASDVLLVLFAGVLFAVFLRGLSDPLSAHTGIGQGWALAFVLIVLAATLALDGRLLGADLANQLDELVPRVRDTWEQARERLPRYEWGQALLADDIGELSPEKAGWLARVTGGIFSNTAGAVAGFVIALFIGLYGAVAPRTYRNGLLLLVPGPCRERSGEVLDAAGAMLRGWLIGAFIKMTIVGVVTTAGLALLGIPLALALGLIAFLFEFIPFLGPILAAVPAVLVALTIGPMEAVHVGLLYLGVQVAESYVLTPLIDQRSVHLPPALAITTQVLLGTLLGALGVVFAIPLTALGMVLVRMLYIEDFLGEQPASRPVASGRTDPGGA